MVMRSDCGRNGRWERVVPERIGMGHSIRIWCIRTSGITARQQTSAGDTRSPRHFRRRLRRTHDNRNSTSFKGLKHPRCEDAVGTAARCRHNHRLLDQCSVLPWLIDETAQPHAPASGTDSAADPLHVRPTTQGTYSQDVVRREGFRSEHHTSLATLLTHGSCVQVGENRMSWHWFDRRRRWSILLPFLLLLRLQRLERALILRWEVH